MEPTILPTNANAAETSAWAAMAGPDACGLRLRTLPMTHTLFWPSKVKLNWSPCPMAMDTLEPADRKALSEILTRRGRVVVRQDRQGAPPEKAPAPAN